MAPPGAVEEYEEAEQTRLPLSRLAAREGDVTQVEHGERVSLSVEDPALQRQQVVAGEQQVQIPEGGWMGGGGGW